MSEAHIFFNQALSYQDGKIPLKYMQIEDCEFDDYKHVASFTRAGHPLEILHYCQNHKVKPQGRWNPLYSNIRSMRTGDIILYSNPFWNNTPDEFVRSTYLLLGETFHNITFYDNPEKLESKFDQKIISNSAYQIDKNFNQLRKIDGSEFINLKEKTLEKV